MRVHFPISTGAVHESFSCVFMFVQLNKCVGVCGSDLQRGIVVMGNCLRRFCLNIRVVGDISGFFICFALVQFHL